MKKTKIIFLDFDGVISTPECRWNLDPEKITLLEELIKETDAKIVVSSSWSVGSKTAEHFVNKLFNGWTNHTNSIITKDSVFIKAMYDVTDHMGSQRGDEIQRWLDAHKDEVESYVIFDDDGDMLDEQLFNFVHTDGFEGLTTREIKLAKTILNNKKVVQPIRLNWNLRTKWYDKCCNRESNIEQLLLEYHNRFDKDGNRKITESY